MVPLLQAENKVSHKDVWKKNKIARKKIWICFINKNERLSTERLGVCQHWPFTHGVSFLLIGYAIIMALCQTRLNLINIYTASNLFSYKKEDRM